MAHFFGTMRGIAKRISRCGAKATGMEATLSSYQGAIHVYLYHNPITELDEFVVEKRKWAGAGKNELLLNGNVGDVKWMK